MLGLNLSSDGTNWWAKRRGRIIIQGDADAAGLYWVKGTRLPQIQLSQESQLEGPMAGTSRNVTMSSAPIFGHPSRNESSSDSHSERCEDSSGNEGDEVLSQASGKPNSLKEFACHVSKPLTCWLPISDGGIKVSGAVRTF